MSAVLPFSAAPVAGAACFHCGEPAPQPVHALVQGASRVFCCPGCEAVAIAICDQGLGDYYRLRAKAAAKADSAQEKYDALYDDPLFQKEFVRATADGRYEASLLLEGVRCSACVWLIEETLKHLPGVEQVEINYVTRHAQLLWQPERTKLSEVLRRIAAVGYRAHPYRGRQVEALQQAEKRRWLWRLFVAAFGMMQVMMYAAPAYLTEGGDIGADMEALMRWASLLLTLPVVFYSAEPFFRGALREWRSRRLGMDFPVALGVAIGFGASTWATVSGSGQVYFDSVTMFVFVLLLGRFLESVARARAGEGLARLGGLVPAFGTRLPQYPASMTSERVAIARFAVGEHALVKPGEAIPADGVVISGASEVNEALLTGESASVPKRVGAALIGGSINIASPLVMRIERIGSASVLGGIVRLVERAAAQKQPLAELADRYANRFVIVVLLAAALTAIAWAFVDPSRALWIAVAVLVATCPCALSLATPAALTAATGELARNGLVVTKGHVIEALARSTDIVFDKTGTLTVGAPQVQAVQYFRANTADAAALGAALEAGSEHPIARALIDYARTSSAGPLEALNASNEPGQGVSGEIGGKRYRLGRREFACSDLTAPASLYTEAWLADEAGAIACFHLGDALKPQAVELIGALRAMGKRVHLLSGDGAGSVNEIAGTLGIAEAVADAGPTDKQYYVRALQEQGAVVAMIGDGINDAPVLAQADVSIAMGSGAMLAQTHADAVLTGGDPAQLLTAMRVAERTLNIIRQNLAWGFGYNLLILPAAALGWISPWQAAIGMSASSLLVVFNALRLKRGGD